MNPLQVYVNFVNQEAAKYQYPRGYVTNLDNIINAIQHVLTIWYTALQVGIYRMVLYNAF